MYWMMAPGVLVWVWPGGVFGSSLDSGVFSMEYKFFSPHLFILLAVWGA